MLLAPKRLKLQTSDLTCVFPWTVQTWCVKNFSKRGVCKNSTYWGDTHSHEHLLVFDTCCFFVCCSGEGSQYSGNSDERNLAAMARAIAVHPDTFRVMYFAWLFSPLHCRHGLRMPTATTLSSRTNFPNAQSLDVITRRYLATLSPRLTESDHSNSAFVVFTVLAAWKLFGYSAVARWPVGQNGADRNSLWWSTPRHHLPPMLFPIYS